MHTHPPSHYIYRCVIFSDTSHAHTHTWSPKSLTYLHDFSSFSHSVDSGLRHRVQSYVVPLFIDMFVHVFLSGTGWPAALCRTPQFLSFIQRVSECPILFDAYELNIFFLFLVRMFEFYGVMTQTKGLFSMSPLQRSQVNMVIIYLSHVHRFALQTRRVWRATSYPLPSSPPPSSSFLT